MIKHFLLAALLCLAASTVKAQLDVTVKCPNCKKTFTVTISDDLSEYDDADSDDEEIVDDEDEDPNSATNGDDNNDTGAIAQLTAEEKAVIDEMNFVRTEPQRYVTEVLEPWLKRYRSNGTYKDDRGVTMRTNEGISAVQEAIQVLKAAKPVRKLTAVEELIAAAKFHTSDIGPQGLTSHESTDGTDMSDRVWKYLPNSRSTGECLSFGESTGRGIVRQLIIDDGVPSRGHRSIIMDGKYTKAGVSIGQHAAYKSMCTIDFGN